MIITELERAAIGAADLHSATLPLPTFLGIGASRSGSTSLAEALRRHPDIWMHPLKGIDHFSRDEHGRLPPWFTSTRDALVPRTLDDYGQLFEGAAGYQARGEFSVSYLDAPVAERIARALPDVKLICLLRHPVDQARSWAAVCLGRQPSMSELSLMLDGRPDLRVHGQYHDHLAPYFDHFLNDQVWVRTFEHLTDPIHREQVLFDLQLFLGVRPIALELPHWNRSGVVLDVPSGPKALAKRLLPDGAVRVLAGILHRARERKAPPPGTTLPPAFKAIMMAKWYPDVVPGLERLGVDVGAWRLGSDESGT